MKLYVPCAVLVALPFAAFAQSTLTDVAQATATVPHLTYRSVWASTSLGVEQTQLDWRQANAQVGRFARGHVDIVKAEELDAGKAPSQPAATPHKH